MTSNEVKQQGDVHRRFSVALVGVTLYLVLDAVAQSLPPHYSPVSQAESDLAVGPFGYIMTINFLNRGALSLEFLFAFIGTLRLSQIDLRGYRAGFFLFGAWSIGALLLAVFPTDVPATPVSWHGAAHLLVALVAFLGGAFGVLAISLKMRAEGWLVRVRRVALPLAVLSVLLCLLELLAPGLAPHVASHFGGLFERAFLGSVLLWIAVVSAYMLRTGASPKVSAPPS